MNHRPECLPCCLRRVLHAADRTTPDEWLHRKILAEAMAELADSDARAPPAEVVHAVTRRAVKVLGVADPYAEEKRLLIEEALALEGRARAAIEAAPDPFAAAVKLSIASNILDCELRQDFARAFSLKGMIESCGEIPLSGELVGELRSALDNAGTVLFVHSSAGELPFDRLLIERAGKPRERVVSVVREAPILAQATREDASLAGLDRVAAVRTPGADCLGLPLNACSEDLRAAYAAADVVVAKGQAAFETLEGKDARLAGEDKPIFFLLRVKCALLARQLGASVGDLVLEVG
ncbi:MAG: DUF89 family protein [Planctomycetes bacterium]|nr:DUF89 family protein [Planctomycetota bacterium]